MARTKQWDGWSANFSNSGSTKNIRYKCPWSDVTVEVASLLNAADSDTTWLFCTSVGVNILGDANEVSGGPKHAMLTASFKNKEWSNDSTPATGIADWSINWELGAQAITVGPGFEWADDVPITETDQAMVVPLGTVTYNGARSSDFTPADIAAYIGKVNDGVWQGFALETVMLSGLTTSKGNSGADGSDIWISSYTFGYNPKGWNMVWRKKTQTFQRVYRISDGVTGIYESTDFDGLKWS